MEIKAITIRDNEAYLRQVSLPVNLDDSNLEADIKTLEELCKERGALAMAAVQLGIPKRLVYLKNTNLELVKKFHNDTITEEEKEYDEARVLINPVIISREGLTEYWEACVSCLNYMGLVKRPYKIVVEYEDINGKKHIDNFEGFEATVLSHEMDHLDGILHIDIADEIIDMPQEERKVWRQTHGYKVFSKTGEYENLLKNCDN